MPDRRQHRGPHPDDVRLFDESQVATLRRAVEEYAWLLTRGYADRSALKLVGDRHDLTARQRVAVWRSACSDERKARRADSRQPVHVLRGTSLGADGYNLLITVESALSGGVILIGRDGCYRDLASVHGTYRKVSETVKAIEMIAGYLAELGLAKVDWYLDRPVSNSGRLKTLTAEILEARGWEGPWNIELVDSPDAALASYGGVVASSDGWVLDRCGRWVNLAPEVLQFGGCDPWMVDLRASSG